MGMLPATSAGFGSSLEFIMDVFLMNPTGLNSFQCRRAKHREMLFFSHKAVCTKAGDAESP